MTRWLLLPLLLLSASTLGAQVPAGRVDFETPKNHGGFSSWAFSPNGKWVAGGTGAITASFGSKTTQAGGELIIWDARKGRILKNFGAHGDRVDFVAFSSDAKTVVSGCTGEIDQARKDPPLIRVWDVRRAKMKRQFHPGARAKVAPRVSPDGKRLVWLGQKKDDRGRTLLGLEVWDMTTGKKRWSLENCGVEGFDITPDGKTIVATYEQVEQIPTERKGSFRIKTLGKGVVAWHLMDGDEVWRMSLDKERDFRPAPVLFLSSGKQFVTIERGRAVFWDAKDGARGKTVELKELKSVRTVAISTDGKRIANVDFMGEGLMLWDLETGQRKLHLEAEFPNNYGNICFAQDLRRVAGEVPGKTKDKFSAVPPGVFPLE